MAKQRYISTSFYSDNWIHSLDPSEKFLYMYLLTNDQTEISGVYKIMISRIAFDTGFNETTINHILEKFQKAGKAYYYDNEYIVLPSFPKHQKVDERSKIKQGIISQLKKLNNRLLRFLIKVNYQFDLRETGVNIDTVLIGYQYGSDYSDIDLDMKTDTDSDLNTDTDLNSDSDTESKRSGENFDDVMSTEDDVPIQLASYFFEQRKLIKPDFKFNRYEHQTAIDIFKELLKEKDLSEIKSVIRQSTSDMWFSRIRGCNTLQSEYNKILQSIKKGK